MTSDDLLTCVAKRLNTTTPSMERRIGVAVSGGGDSIALLHLVHRWATEAGHEVEVITVDHGLRVESAAEAETVARTTRELNLSHHTAKWTGWTGQGNLQDAARMARRNLIEDWARSRGVDTVLTGHTRDDQAETVLMRLNRGSGVDGLAGMAEVEQHSIRWLRPLLNVSRAELRAYLTAKDVDWIDDPSNDDMSFDRIKARHMIAAQLDAEVMTRRLAETARHMRAAQEVLEGAAIELAQRAVTQDHGDLLFNRALFDAAPQETRSRLLARALMWVASSPYRPRFAALSSLMEAGKGTLHGCHVTQSVRVLRITREYQAVRDVTCATTQLWDSRWVVTGPHAADLHIAALGEAGDLASPVKGESGQPAITRYASPAIFRKDTLIAAPLIGFSNGWRVELARNTADFKETLRKP